MSSVSNFVLAMCNVNTTDAEPDFSGELVCRCEVIDDDFGIVRTYQKDLDKFIPNKLASDILEMINFELRVNSETGRIKHILDNMPKDQNTVFLAVIYHEATPVTIKVMYGKADTEDDNIDYFRKLSGFARDFALLK